MYEYTWRSADELARAYRSGECTPTQAVEAALARIAAVDSVLNSMVTVTAEGARAQAADADIRFRAGEELPPLFGIPVTVKDLTDTAGVRTTYGTVLHTDHVPEVDALAWSRLKEAGAILIGKSTTPEYGMRGVTESLLTGATSTPWMIGRNAGGSSGGAAAGVAAGIVPLAWGSDGGGSIRVPSALCGVVGIKPSTGRIPHADNEDADGTEGPIARTVLDAAVMLDATVGRHVRDRFTIPSTGERFADSARRPGDLTGLRVAASVDLGQGEVHPDTRAAFEAALDVLRNLGAEVTNVTPVLPSAGDFFIKYWGPEFATFVDEMDAADQPVWNVIRRLADRARGLGLGDVSAAMRSVKTQIYNAYADVFENHDVVVTPTTPFPAPPHPGDAATTDDVLAEVELVLHRLTEPPSHAGLPAITVPCGFSSDGLPIGLQVVTPLYEDGRAIYVAARYEQATEWHMRHPVLEDTPNP